MSCRATPKLAVNHNTCISYCRWDRYDEDIARTTYRCVASLALSAHMQGQMRVGQPLSASNLLPKDIPRKVMAFVHFFRCAILSIQVDAQKVLRRFDVHRSQHLRQMLCASNQLGLCAFADRLHFKVESGLM